MGQKGQERGGLGLPSPVTHLGLQADVSSERVIRSEDGETLARVSGCLVGRVTGGGKQRLALRTRSPWQEYGVPFMETSAKTGMNVELAFLAIAK